MVSEFMNPLNNEQSEIYNTCARTLGKLKIALLCFYYQKLLWKFIKSIHAFTVEEFKTSNLNSTILHTLCSCLKYILFLVIHLEHLLILRLLISKTNFDDKRLVYENKFWIFRGWCWFMCTRRQSSQAGLVINIRISRWERCNRI